MTEATERTLILVKPDGVERGLVGEVIRRVEAKGYHLVALEIRVPTPDLLASHYAEHEGKPFYQPLIDFIKSKPIITLITKKQRIIKKFHSLTKTTNPTTTLPNTIHSDLNRN